jgi:hypothetical protein
MEKKQKQKQQLGKCQEKDHPYLLLYDKLQDEVIANFNVNNTFGLGEAASYPSIQEPDEWER